MQLKKQVQNPQLPVFNIRKVPKKVGGLGKNLGDAPIFTPESDHEKLADFQNFSSIFQSQNDGHDARKQKQKILDQTVNQAIMKSKVYSDLKKTHQQTKKKNLQQKKKIEASIEKHRDEKKQLKLERQKLQKQKQKFIEAINAMKDKLQNIREANDKYREALSNNGIRIGQNGEQAQYLSNLIMSMRFQAEYQHDIDPDQMTYQQLLELQEKIGHVSRGLPPQVIAAILPKIQIIQQNNPENEDKCMVCISPFQKGEIKTILNKCKHQFHYECMEGWLGKQKICPLCKQQILWTMQEQAPQQTPTKQ